MLTAIFEPVAQNTVIRPMAQAICIASGGKDVPYIDPTDAKEKCISVMDVCHLRLKTEVNGRNIDVSGDELAFRARHETVWVRFDANDVQVMVTPKMTLVEAMVEFRKKIAIQNERMMALARKHDTTKQRD